jgi:hypothetical protein
MNVERAARDIVMTKGRLFLMSRSLSRIRAFGSFGHHFRYRLHGSVTGWSYKVLKIRSFLDLPNHGR